MSAARARALLLAVALAAPALAVGHGVELDVERREGGIAVRARHHGAPPLAGATYVVLSPAGNGRVHDAGRTDRHGWMAFVPDAPGRWTVRIVDESGHGEVAEIDVAPESIAAPSAPAASSAAPPAQPVPRSPPPPLASADAVERASSIYRVVAGLAVIGLVFFVAFAVAVRRRGAGR